MLAQAELFQNPIHGFYNGAAFAVDYKTYFMKAYITTLILALGLLFSHTTTFAQDSSKVNTMQTKLDRSERKEARLRKKAERKQKKAGRKEKKLARQERKSARKERKLQRKQRKLERRQEKNGSPAPSQSAGIFYNLQEDGAAAA